MFAFHLNLRWILITGLLFNLYHCHQAIKNQFFPPPPGCTPRHAELENLPEAALQTYALPDQIQPGQTVYTTHCQACHGVAGQGLIGPNLTDKYWLHGQGQGHDILKTLRTGVAEKGMVSYECILSAEELKQVTGYILSLQGSQPPNPKAPEGQLIP